MLGSPLDISSPMRMRGKRKKERVKPFKLVSRGSDLLNDLTMTPNCCSRQAVGGHMPGVACQVLHVGSQQ
jgi:hypothetical protein